VDAWLADGMSGRSDKTIAKYGYVLKPVLARIGGRVLRDLTAADIRTALQVFAASHSTETVSIARLSLERAIRHAEGQGKVRRNVAALVDAPEGRPGRPSKSRSPEQAETLVKAAHGNSMRAYILLSLITGIRTEEARALRWDQVDLKGDSDAEPSMRRQSPCGDLSARTVTPRSPGRGERWRSRRRWSRHSWRIRSLRRRTVIWLAISGMSTDSCSPFGLHALR
jgi:integrase